MQRFPDAPHFPSDEFARTAASGSSPSAFQSRNCSSGSATAVGENTAGRTSRGADARRATRGEVEWRGSAWWCGLADHYRRWRGAARGAVYHSHYGWRVDTGTEPRHPARYAGDIGTALRGELVDPSNYFRSTPTFETGENSMRLNKIAGVGRTPHEVLLDFYEVRHAKL